jgi:Leucine-rich repeat (LRR) protein
MTCLSNSENQIVEFTDSFCSYAQFKHSLIKLDPSKNKLRYEKFSYKIALFEELKKLDLSKNAFEQIPCILPKNLETLNFNRNRIRTLMTKPIAGTVRNDEEVLNILGLNAIFKGKKNAMSKKINIDLLTANEHTQVEKEKAKESMYDQPDVDRREEYVLPYVFYLRNLKSLHLAYNNIQDIPTDFSILNSNLKSLDLSFNLLTQINVSLCRGFSNLKFLNLESNKIKDMSDKLRELNELEYLNLNNNRLVTLSYELCFDLKRLRELHLSGNLLEKLPQFASTRKIKLKSGNGERRSENGAAAAACALTPS